MVSIFNQGKLPVVPGAVSDVAGRPDTALLNPSSPPNAETTVDLLLSSRSGGARVVRAPEGVDLGPGDVILAIDGTPVAPEDDVDTWNAQLTGPVGLDVTVRVQSDGEERDVRLPRGTAATP